MIYLYTISLLIDRLSHVLTLMQEYMHYAKY